MMMMARMMTMMVMIGCDRDNGVLGCGGSNMHLAPYRLPQWNLPAMVEEDAAARIYNFLLLSMPYLAIIIIIAIVIVNMQPRRHGASFE